MGLDVTKAGVGMRPLSLLVGVGYDSPQGGDSSSVEKYSFISHFSFPGTENNGSPPPNSQFSARYIASKMEWASPLESVIKTMVSFSSNSFFWSSRVESKIFVIS